MKKIGVVLSGCGYLDGAEIREAVLALLALDQKKAVAVCLAPDIEQLDVVDHGAGNPIEKHRRNVWNESARIARGEITRLGEVDPASLDGVILPGGYGVAKNLSNFALEGANGSVIEELSFLVLAMHAHQKPVGAICIAPAVLALLFKDKDYHCTVGQDPSTIAEIEKLNGRHEIKGPREICVDEKNKIVSTPAYMLGDANLADIFVGIKSCVDRVVDWA